VEFAILTRDRDLKDAEPYPGIPRDAWTRRDGVEVRYASPAEQTARGLAAALRSREYDVLYLNSLWSRLSRRVLLLRWLGRLPRRPVVLAPRGELAAGALRIRPGRKRAFLAAARAAGLLRGIVWQATSPAELSDVSAQSGPGAVVVLAPNASLPLSADAVERPPKMPGELRLVFLSRISEKKNLVGALELLREVRGRVTLDIYGLPDREDYWQRCLRAMEALPAHVRCTWHGWVAPDQVSRTLAGYHAFFLPTFDENFGHAIVEAMRAGCPPIISDRTPWRGLVQARAGWDVPLDQPERMRAAVEEAVAMDQDTWEAWAAGTRAFAEDRLRAKEAGDAHLRLFRAAAGRDRTGGTTSRPVQRAGDPAQPPPGDGEI
jgi:glycosyltransferase involved in cell wall biosynthesis